MQKDKYSYRKYVSRLELIYLRAANISLAKYFSRLSRKKYSPITISPFHIHLRITHASRKLCIHICIPRSGDMREPLPECMSGLIVRQECSRAVTQWAALRYIYKGSVRDIRHVVISMNGPLDVS